MRNQRDEPMRGTNERKGGRPKAQENQSKLIQARKTLKARDRVLMSAIRRCHVQLAKKESLWDIETSKDAVEAAWKEFNHANSRYCVCAGWETSRKEDPPEEVRRAEYEWKVLTDMMEQVVDKAEEYLESATKENSWGELREDEDGGNELDAEVELRLWVEQLSTMSKVNEMVLEVSAVNEVNVNEVNVNEVNVNEVNVNTEAKEVCGVKEETSKGKSLEIETKVEVNEKSEEVVTKKPPDVLQRFDFTAKVQEEEFSMKEVKKSQEDKEVEILPPMKEVKESRHANWDPGELIDAKARTEMFNVKVEVMPSGDVNAKVLFDAMSLFNLVRLYISEVLVLVALRMARFVNVNPMSSRTFAESFLPILSDYG